MRNIQERRREKKKKIMRLSTSCYAAVNLLHQSNSVSCLFDAYVHKMKENKKQKRKRNKREFILNPRFQTHASRYFHSPQNVQRLKKKNSRSIQFSFHRKKPELVAANKSVYYLPVLSEKIVPICEMTV